MTIEEGEDMQAKGIENTFNKLIAENFSNLKKEGSYRYRRHSGHQTDKSRKEPLQGILQLKH
jgi:hypothetical protein